MNRRLVMSAMALSVSLFGAQAVHAYGHVTTPVRASVVMKEKLVKFSIRNDSKTPVKLKAGDAEVSIEPGKTVSVKFMEGTPLTVLEAANHDPGATITTVTDALSGSTIALH